MPAKNKNAAPKRTTPEQIEKALNLLVDGYVDQFNTDLEIARRVYRSNPKLVKSARYPEPWGTLYMEQHGGDAPSDKDTEKAPSVAQIRKNELQNAREVATGWCGMKHFEKYASLVDAMLLRDLVNRFMSIDDFPGVLAELFADADSERRKHEKVA